MVVIEKKQTNKKAGRKKTVKGKLKIKIKK
jgi:hypothetical protein